MAYTRRTCGKCGFRDIQPNMRQRTITYESGSSVSGASKRTWLGVALGDKASANAIKRSWFNSSKRKYFRNKKVWVCKKCADKMDASAKRQKRSDRFWHAVIVVLTLWSFHRLP
jgi:hypothetical protein